MYVTLLYLIKLILTEINYYAGVLFTEQHKGYQKGLHEEDITVGEEKRSFGLRLWKWNAFRGKTNKTW